MPPIFGWKQGEADSNDDDPFTAIFEGNGHILSNLCIVGDGDSSDHDALGLFGHLRGATVRNLTIAAVYIESSFALSALIGGAQNANRLGALAGYVTGDAAILNVAATDGDSEVDLQGAETEDGQHIGGLVGDLETGSIASSYAALAVNGGDGNPPAGVYAAADLTADNAGAEWSSIVWDFGDGSQAPALRYISSYTFDDGTDGMLGTSDDSHTYSCDNASFVGLAVICGTTLLPGQR